ncbi:MAG: CvpA family protein [Bacteroidales bacterium]|nr:CvpA family protein [Bacteroidales bacterium]
MNWIDWIFIIFFIWSIYQGFTKGIVIMLASLLALVLGIYGSIKFSGYTAEILFEKFQFNPGNLNLISFIITFIIIVIAIQLLARLLDKFVEAVSLGFINRLAGVIFSILKTALIISVFLVIIERIDERVPFLPRSDVQNSLLYHPLHSLAPFIYPYLRSGYEQFREDNTVTDEIIACKIQPGVIPAHDKKCNGFTSPIK